MEPTDGKPLAGMTDSAAASDQKVAVERIALGITRILNQVLTVITVDLEMAASSSLSGQSPETDSLGHALATARRAVGILGKEVPLAELEEVLHLEFASLGTGSGQRFVLSPREREVLHWIATGKTHVETASILGISERTVEQHVRNSKKKLNAVSTIQAVVEAINQREIHP